MFFLLLFGRGRGPPKQQKQIRTSPNSKKENTPPLSPAPSERVYFFAVWAEDVVFFLLFGPVGGGGGGWAVIVFFFFWFCLGGVFAV